MTKFGQVCPIALLALGCTAQADQVWDYTVGVGGTEGLLGPNTPPPAYGGTLTATPISGTLTVQIDMVGTGSNLTVGNADAVLDMSDGATYSLPVGEFANTFIQTSTGTNTCINESSGIMGCLNFAGANTTLNYSVDSPNQGAGDSLNLSPGSVLFSAWTSPSYCGGLIVDGSSTKGAAFCTLSVSGAGAKWTEVMGAPEVDGQGAVPALTLLAAAGFVVTRKDRRAMSVASLHLSDRGL